MALVILKTLVDIYGKPNALGIQKIVKRNVECKKTFDTHTIQLEEYVKPNGEISSRWCSIREGDSYYRIGHSFDYVNKLISPIEFKGFNYKKENINEKQRSKKSSKTNK